MTAEAAEARPAPGQIDPMAKNAPSGEPWAYAVRTCGPNGEAYKGFVWPLEPGAVATAPDFEATPACGHGLHLNPWGMGDWSLHAESDDAVWLLVRYDPALAVDIHGGENGGKIKAPWAVVDQVELGGGIARLMGRLTALRSQRLSALSGDSAHTATSGNRAHAATSGNSAHAATSGYSAHAATSGYSAHAATSGNSAHAATSGEAAIAAALGGFGARARAGVGGAIVLAEHEWDDHAAKQRLLSVFASKVGENGIEPNVWYELKDGKPVAVAS